MLTKKNVIFSFEPRPFKRTVRVISLLDKSFQGYESCNVMFELTRHSKLRYQSLNTNRLAITVVKHIYKTIQGS